MSEFTELGVPARLAAVLTASGKDHPFPIQRDTLPDSLAGRDVLGRGRTGSGKTIAFALPLVARLASGRAGAPGSPRGLVLAPTRELATQIAATIEPLAAAVGLRVATVFGGVGQKPQEKALRAGTEIIVACPGRLDDLMKQGIARLDRVEVTVLDEADHMADLGFLPVVTRILAATPQGGQRLLFSATLDRGVDGIAKRFLRDPRQHEVDESSLPDGEMTHRVLLVDTADQKSDLVRELASGAGRRILFTRTKHQAKKLAKQLTAAGIPAVDLHGNLSQGARDRNLASFGADAAAGGVRVLVATDVAARGVHVDDVELVVHVDPPMEHKAYLHRSGRTARAGASGTVVTVGLASQARDVASLMRAASIQVRPENVTPDAAVVAELVGERAPHRTPAAAPASASRPQGARSGGTPRESTGRGGAARSGGSRSGSGGRRSGGPRSGSGAGSVRTYSTSSISGTETPRSGQRTPRAGSALADSGRAGSGRPNRQAPGSGASTGNPRRNRRAGRPGGSAR
ncbi:MAG: DEAD/DEAH box helicase [Micrococcales bacterium]|nr:DEAD/DEAH box helicase [Micrococcales bacterium]